MEASGMGRQHRQPKKSREEGVSSLPTQALWHQKAIRPLAKPATLGKGGQAPQSPGQGPRPRHSCPTFPAAAASGGRGLGRDRQEGEAARHPAVACFLPGPLWAPATAL